MHRVHYLERGRVIVFHIARSCTLSSLLFIVTFFPLYAENMRTSTSLLPRYPWPVFWRIAARGRGHLHYVVCFHVDFLCFFLQSFGNLRGSFYTRCQRELYRRKGSDGPMFLPFFLTRTFCPSAPLRWRSTETPYLFFYLCLFTACAHARVASTAPCS